MKKLMGISLVAMLAVSPFAANAAVGDAIPTADPANSGLATGPMTQTMPPYALAVEGANDSKVATAKYVKGAYNATIKAINYVDSKVEGRLGTNLQNLTVTGAENISALGSVDLTKNNYNSGTVGKAIVDVTNKATANQTAITLLNGDAETSGSVAYAIAQEASARDTAIQSAVSAINDTTGGLNTRLTDAEGAITLLNGDAETSGSVAYAVAQEASARNTAITNAVADEASARDTAIEAAVSTINGTTDGLNTRLTDAEGAITLLNGDAETSGSVAYAVAQEASARDTAIQSAVSAINDTTGGLNTRLTDAEGAITLLNGDAETSGSVAYAVAQEASARNTAITNAVADEASARDTAITNAVAAETSARESADTTLQGNIDALSTRMDNADTALQGTYATKAGVTATISASTVTVDVLDTWGSDTPTTVEANITGAGYTAQ